MTNNLESLIHCTETIILDNCALQSQEENPLPERLYLRWQGLKSTPLQMFEDRIFRIEQIKPLLGKTQLVVISESVEEMEDHFRIINGQRKYLSENFPEQNRKKQKKDRSKDRPEYNKLELLRQYCNDLFFVTKGVKNRDPRRIFSRKHYSRVFLMADNYSKDIQAVEANDKQYLHNPTLIGQKLQTDLNIIASAFTLAYENDVLILTADKNLGRLAERISVNIVNPDVKRRYGIDRDPTYKVKVFNPNQKKLSKNKNLFACKTYYRVRKTLVLLAHFINQSKQYSKNC